MKILIVDDEELARARLRLQIKECLPEVIIHEAANGLEALSLCNEQKPDIVMLDIRMPGMDGLEAGRHLGTLEKPPAVIFTTAYGEHALSAFDMNAVDYLLKPINSERLLQAIQKAQQLSHAQLLTLQQVDDGHKARTHISARSHDTLQLIPVQNIIFFRADQKYVTVCHVSRDVPGGTRGEVLIEDSLKSLEQEFDGEFVRIHRNALISIHYINGMEKAADGHFHIILKQTTERLEISRRHLPDIRKLLKDISTPS